MRLNCVRAARASRAQEMTKGEQGDRVRRIDWQGTEGGVSALSAG